MIEWIFAKMVAGWVKALVIMCACLMPICAAGWIWEGVSLHGIAIPFPIFGPFHLVDGAIHARDLAYKARDKALGDLAIETGNVTRLRAGLTSCNESIEAAKWAGDQRVKDAQKRIDDANKLAGQLGKNLAAILAIRSSSETCPVADSIFKAGFGQ